MKFVLQEVAAHKVYREREIVPTSDRIVFGRGLQADYVLTDISGISPERSLISRVQATLFLDGDRWFLADGDGITPSSNGVFVGESRITAPVEMKADTEVYIFRKNGDRAILKMDDGKRTLITPPEDPSKITVRQDLFDRLEGQIQSVREDAKEEFQRFYSRLDSLVRRDKRQDRWIRLITIVLGAIVIFGSGSDLISGKGRENVREAIVDGVLIVVAGGSMGVAIKRESE